MPYKRITYNNVKHAVDRWNECHPELTLISHCEGSVCTIGVLGEHNSIKEVIICERGCGHAFRAFLVWVDGYRYGKGQK